MRYRIFGSGRKWYFILLDGNNRAIACSTRTYTRREDCRKALDKIKAVLQD